MTKRLQNTIAESRWALPIVSIYSLAACLITGMVTQTMGLQLAMLTISAYMMVELNNVNSLIRVYSRMISSSFLVMTVMSLFLFKSVTTGFVQLCAISSLVLLFRTYQEQNATGRVFYAFFALGAASVFFIQILFFCTCYMDSYGCKPHGFQPQNACSIVNRHRRSLLVYSRLLRLHGYATPVRHPLFRPVAVCKAFLL